MAKVLVTVMDKAKKNERDVKQVIVMRKDLKMRRGKENVQAAHASMGWLATRVRDAVTMLSAAEAQWLNGGTKKICVQVESEEELIKIFTEAQKAKLMVHLVTDAGLTEFAGPTKTCLAIGPDYAEKIDPVTGDLKTY